MTPEQAKEICPEASFVEHPSKGFVCRRRLDVVQKLEERSDLCHHKKHFVCELVLYQIRKKAKADRDGEPALSVSRVSKLVSCPRKYAFTYVHRLQDFTRTPGYFKSGDAFGVGRAKLDAGVPFDGKVREDLSVLDRAKVQAALRFYGANPPYPLGVWDCELHVQFELEGFHWVGYIDAISKNREHLVEWKFAAQPYDYLRIVRQAAVYMHAVPEVRTFELIRFKKPQHRPRKKESWRDFEDRILEELEKKGPDEVYERTLIERRGFDAERIVRQMAVQARLHDAVERAQFPPSYGKDCNMCEYKKACQRHVSKPTYLIANLIESGECKL